MWNIQQVTIGVMKLRNARRIDRYEPTFGQSTRCWFVESIFSIDTYSASPEVHEVHCI